MMAKYQLLQSNLRRSANGRGMKWLEHSLNNYESKNKMYPEVTGTTTAWSGSTSFKNAATGV